MSKSPRSEPARVYQYFCEKMKRQPGELGLKISPESRGLGTRADFNALVGQFFIAPKRKMFFFKLGPTIRAWDAEIEQHARTYIKRNRRSPSDNLWELLGLLYWNYAAWIILRGEYKALKKTLRDHQIETRLKGRYGYLAQVQRQGWFTEVKGGNSPSRLAYRDTAEGLEKDEDSFRLMLSPGRLRKSPPAALILVNTDSKKLLSRLLRIRPFKRTPKDRTLIRAIEAEA